MTVATPPQHRDIWGNKLSADLVTSDELLKAANLDWKVDLRDAKMLYDGGYAFDYITVPGKKVVYRTDTQLPLGVVGNRFCPIQNHELYDFGNDIRDDSNAAWYAGGPTRGGKDVWGLLQLGDDILVGGDTDEAVGRYLMLRNTHDGGGCLTALLHKVRLRCTNALNGTIGHGAVSRYNVRHTSNWRERLHEARNVLGISFKHDEEFQKLAEELITSKVDPFGFDRFLRYLIPYRPFHLQTDRSNANREEAREAVRTILATSPDLQNIKHTKWGVYNAVAEYADWHRPVKGNGENRFLRIVNDTSIKTRALELLVA